MHIVQWKSFKILQSEVKKGEKPSGPKQKQATIKSLVDKMTQWSDDDPISKRIDKSVMDLILVDMLPFNVVKGAAFQRLNFNDPNVKRRHNLKSEKLYRNLMLDTYDQVKQKVKLKILKSDWISFTTDIW